jgi:hypothetical protein
VLLIENALARNRSMNTQLHYLGIQQFPEFWVKSKGGSHLLVLLRRNLLEKVGNALPRWRGEAQRLEKAQHLSDGAVEYLKTAVIRLRVDIL